MKWNAARAVSAVFALVLTAALAGEAHASCGSSQRIDHDDADCLDAGWDNSTNWLSHGKAWARNLCPEHGTVVAKVDIKGGKDKTWYLKDGDKKSEGTNVLNTREISCCSDLSDICDTSDLSADGCLHNFRGSSANDTCLDVSTSINSDHQCTITARCRRQDNFLFWASATVDFDEVRDLHNCTSGLKGKLEVGGC